MERRRTALQGAKGAVPVNQAPMNRGRAVPRVFIGPNRRERRGNAAQGGNPAASASARPLHNLSNFGAPMADILDELARAENGSRDLDACVYKAFGYVVKRKDEVTSYKSATISDVVYYRRGRKYKVRLCTTDLGDALRFAETVHPIRGFSLGYQRAADLQIAHLFGITNGVRQLHKILPIAICMAVIKLSRLETEISNEPVLDFEAINRIKVG